MREVHHIIWCKETEQVIFQDAPGSSQTQLGGSMAGKPGGGTPFIYNRQRMIDGLATCIAVDERPFNFGEKEGMCEWITNTLNPNFKPVCRKNVKRVMQQQYWIARGEIIQMFGSFRGRVSLTSDCWTSPQGDPYICVTVHWCDSHYNIQKRIIAFDEMDESHNAANIYNRINQTLMEFNISNKVFCISFDNASANTASIDYMKQNMELLLDGQLVHVRCCAHILNLCVQDGLVHLYDIVSPVRRIVKWFRKNSNISRKFKDWCKNKGLKKRHFTGDCKTRWNSTFYMLKEALQYNEIITTIYNDEMIKNANPSRITPDLWYLAEKVCTLFESFDKATKVFSQVYEPNVHLVIMECYKIVTAMSDCNGISPDLDELVNAMKSKWMNYLQQFPYLYGVACMLDPGVKRENLNIILNAYYEQLDVFDFDIDEYITNCYDILIKLYDIYHAEKNPENASSSSGRPPKSGRFAGAVGALFSKNKKAASANSNARSVVESYFDNAYSDESNDDDFNVLKYWRDNSKHYPILAAIARDILVVPASTVASESAFSCGRRIITDYRASLNPESVKIQICKRDWDRAVRRTQDLVSDEEKERDEDPWLVVTTATESGTSQDEN